MTREDGSLRKCFPVAEENVREGVRRTEEAYTPMGDGRFDELAMNWRNVSWEK
jgi:hypothetical protein